MSTAAELRSGMVARRVGRARRRRASARPRGSATSSPRHATAPIVEPDRPMPSSTAYPEEQSARGVRPAPAEPRDGERPGQQGHRHRHTERHQHQLGVGHRRVHPAERDREEHRRSSRRAVAPVEVRGGGAGERGSDDEQDEGPRGKSIHAGCQERAARQRERSADDGAGNRGARSTAPAHQSAARPATTTAGTGASRVRGPTPAMAAVVPTTNARPTPPGTPKRARRSALRPRTRSTARTTRATITPAVKPAPNWRDCTRVSTVFRLGRSNGWPRRGARIPLGARIRRSHLRIAEPRVGGAPSR